MGLVGEHIPPGERGHNPCVTKVVQEPPFFDYPCIRGPGFCGNERNQREL